MLTVSQSRVLNFLTKSIHQDQIVPTYREIAEATGLSQSGVRFVAMELEALGYLRRRDHKFRALQVLRQPAEEEAVA